MAWPQPKPSQTRVREAVKSLWAGRAGSTTSGCDEHVASAHDAILPIADFPWQDWMSALSPSRSLELAVPLAQSGHCRRPRWRSQVRKKPSTDRAKDRHFSQLMFLRLHRDTGRYEDPKNSGRPHVSLHSPRAPEPMASYRLRRMTSPDPNCILVIGRDKA